MKIPPYFLASILILVMALGNMNIILVSDSLLSHKPLPLTSGEKLSEYRVRAHDININDNISRNTPPAIILNSPSNKSVFTQGIQEIVLNATVTDPDHDDMTFRFFVGGTENISQTHGLVYEDASVRNGIALECNLTSVPLTPDPGTVLLLHLDNRSDLGENKTYAHDHSGNGNGGILRDRNTLNSDGDTPPVFQMAKGKFAGAFRFDGTDDLISVPHSPEFNSPSRSVEAWIRSDRITQIGNLAGREDDTANGSFLALEYNWNVILLRVGNGTHAIELSHVLPPDIGVWHHVAGTYDNETLRLYVDGELRANGTLKNGINNITRPWVIGANPRWLNSGFFNGTIDEVAVYDRALSGNEIMDHYRLREGAYHWYVSASDGDSEKRSEKRVFYVDPTIYGVRFAHPGHRVVDLSSNATYTITVTNVGEVPDNYTLVMTNFNNASTAVLDRSVIEGLSPNSSMNVSLTVGDTTPREYIIKLEVRSDTNSNFTDDIDITTHSALDTLAVGTYDIYNDTKGIAKIKNMGGNMAILSVGSADVFFPSKYLPKSWWISDTHMKDMVDLAHSEGLKVYAWWGMPHDYWLAPERHPEWISILSNGTPTNFSSNDYFHRIIPPARIIRTPEYLAQLKGVIGEIVKLGFDGIDINDNFQFLCDSSFDNFTVSAFGNDTGTAVIGSTLPERAAYIKNFHWNLWHEWRADQVTELLSLMQQYVRDAGSDIPLRPHLMVGYSHYTDWGYDLEGICGAVDMPYAMLGMGPGNITHSLNQLVVAGAKKIATSLYLSWIEGGKEERLAENMKAVRECGARGINLFNYGIAENKNLWGTMKDAVDIANLDSVPTLTIGGKTYDGGTSRSFTTHGRTGSSRVYVTSTAEINLTVEANGTICYRIDNGSWREYRGNFTIPMNGSHFLEYYSKAYIGSSEPLRWCEIFIDDDAPASVLAVGRPQFGGSPIYITSGTEFNISAIDNRAGPISIFYGIDDGIWMDYYSNFTIVVPGPHTIYYCTSDDLGNNETVRRLDVFVDDVPPESRIVFGEPHYNASEVFVVSDTMFNISAADEGAGVRSIRYRIDSEEWREEWENFTLSDSGMHTIAYCAVDNLGNEENERKLTVFVDDTPPKSNISIGQPNYGATPTYVTSSTNVNMSSIDEGAGTSFIYYRIDSGSFVRYSDNFTLSGVGEYTITYYAEDNLGNRESARTYDVFVDDDPPVVTMSPGNISAGNIEMKNGGNITFDHTDKCPGLVMIFYRIGNEKNWSGYVGSIKIEFNTSVEYYAVDALGNRGGNYTINITVMNETNDPKEDDDNDDNEDDENDDNENDDNEDEIVVEDDDEDILFTVMVVCAAAVALIVLFILYARKGDVLRKLMGFEEKKGEVEVGTGEVEPEVGGSKEEEEGIVDGELEERGDDEEGMGAEGIMKDGAVVEDAGGEGGDEAEEKEPDQPEGEESMDREKSESKIP